nr:PHD finger protein 7-like [Anser cygnoides]
MAAIEEEKAPKPQEDERMLCRRSDSHMDGCGPMEQVDGVCAHVFCLYPAQGLSQRDADKAGLCRFLPADIRRVAKTGYAVMCFGAKQRW